MVVLGFILVMTPLVYLLYQASAALTLLSERTETYTQDALQSTRYLQQLGNQSQEMARSARQYLILEDERLLSRYLQQRQQFQQLLETPNQPQLQAIAQALLPYLRQLSLDPVAQSWSAEQLNESFQRLQEALQQARQRIQQETDHYLDQLNNDSHEQQRQLLGMTAILLTLALILMGLSVMLITRPVRHLEQLILMLGEGKPLPSRPIQGPAELAALGQRLSWLHQQLNSLEQQKKQFLRHMSHELKTPLSSLREGADLLAEEIAGPLSPMQREISQLLQQNSLQLQRLIEQLLDYNMLHQAIPLAIQEHEISQLIEESLGRHQLSLRQKGIQLERQGQALHWWLDSSKFQRCLDNLITNALFYGHPQGKLLLSWQATQDSLEVLVANTGPTIAAEDAQRIFDPFYQGQSRRHGPLKGSGIGLSIARDCIEAHGGSLTLTTHPEYDVCFSIRLPKPAYVHG